MVPSRLKKPNNLRAIQILKWLVFLLISAALWTWRYQFLEILSLVREKDALVAYLQSFGAWMPLLLSSVIVLQVVVAAIPGHLLYAAGGYTYGFVGGFLLSWTITVLAGQLTFAMARKWGKPLVDRFASGTEVERWQLAAKGRGFTFFLIAFMIPIFPADLMTYVAGLSSIAARSFLAANLLGRIPVVVIMTLVGSHGLQLTLPVWIAAGLISVIAFLALRHLAAGWRCTM